jgi:ZIP family zinc transporter
MLDVFVISLLAGLATALGGIIVSRSKIKIGCKSLGFGLGFSGGVMIIIAFISLFFKALEFGTYITAVIAFMGGALLMMLMDFFVPHQYIVKENRFKNEKQLKFMEMGILVSIGITLHNFPEGAIVGVGYSLLPNFGIMLALAIAIHNIPEGIAVAMPLKAAGTKASKIFLITLFSGLAEVLGAVIAALFLVAVPQVIPIALAFTGGVMVYLSMDELIPVATKYCGAHYISIGLVVGMLFALLLEAMV